MPSPDAVPAAHPGGERRGAALLAGAALALAALAQLLLERVQGFDRIPTPRTAGALFLAACVLAILASRKGGVTERAVLVSPMIRWPWFVACVPGALLLGWAGALSYRAPVEVFPPAIHASWKAGLLLVLAPGVVHAVVRRWRGRAAAPPPLFARREVVALVLVALVAAAFRIPRIETLPGPIDADEAACGWYAMRLHVEVNQDLFWFSWESVANMTFALFDLGQRLFGFGLYGHRMIGAVLASLSAGLLAALGTRLFGFWAGLSGGALLAVSATDIHFSRTGTGYWQTSFFTVLVLYLVVRAFTGGGLLSVVMAAAALGIGVQTYAASRLIPLLLVAVALGWLYSFREGRGRGLAAGALIGVIAGLLAGPVLANFLKSPELRMARAGTISIFGKERMAEAEARYGVSAPFGVLREQLTIAAMAFNRSESHYPCFECERSMVDGVTAAALPLGVALLAVTIVAPESWLLLVWLVSFTAVGMGLTSEPPAYARGLGSLPAACLIAGIALVRLLRLASLGRRPAFASLLLASILAAGWLNFRYYFMTYLEDAQMDWRTLVERTMFRYRETHLVLDGTRVQMTTDRLADWLNTRTRRRHVDLARPAGLPEGLPPQPALIIWADMPPTTLPLLWDEIPPPWRLVRRFTVESRVARLRCLELAGP